MPPEKKSEKILSCSSNPYLPKGCGDGKAGTTILYVLNRTFLSLEK